jgi:hypothetical protein
LRTTCTCPATPDDELPESVALLYYPVTVHHDFIEGNRITQLAYEGARQLQRKLGVFYAGFEVDRAELDPPWTDSPELERYRRRGSTQMGAGPFTRAHPNLSTDIRRQIAVCPCPCPDRPKPRKLTERRHRHWASVTSFALALDAERSRETRPVSRFHGGARVFRRSRAS